MTPRWDLPFDWDWNDKQWPAVAASAEARLWEDSGMFLQWAVACALERAYHAGGNILVASAWEDLQTALEDLQTALATVGH